MIDWKKDDTDRAFHAESGEYRLEANLATVQENFWVWCVQFRGRPILGGSGSAVGPDAARVAAEWAYLWHTK